ncbi:hypothetical protein OKW46_007696 [Paraburkholderia sp. WSM4179]|nr:hypothetical protein [Paraburkholderia sp. WSM4179]
MSAIVSLVVWEWKILAGDRLPEKLADVLAQRADPAIGR